MSDIKILIVADEQLLALDLQKKLEKMGFGVTGIADTGELALSQAEETHPHLVLMDIVMAGELDGIETAKLVRQRFNIPVICLTAFNDEETNQRAKLSEPFAYLIKPFNERELKFIIETAIYKHNLERKLKESEEKCRIMFNLSPEAIVLLDTEGKILDINERIFDWLGCKPGEIIGKNFLELSYLTNGSKGKVMEKFSQRIRGIEVPPYELDFITGKGCRRIGRVSGTLIRDEDGKVIRDLVIISDVTEHKQSKEAMQKERDRAQRYLDVAGVIIVAINLNQEVELINQKGCEVLGYSVEEIVGKNWFDHFLPVGEMDKVKIFFDQLMRGKIEPVQYFENPVLTRSGEKRIIAWHNILLKDKTGSIIGTLSSGEDITERKKAEEAMRGSEERYRTLQANIPVGVLRSTLEGKIISVNPAMVKMFGYESEEELLALHAVDLYCVPMHREELIDLLIDKGEATNFEVQMKRKDGSTFWSSLNIKALTDEQGKITHFDGILEDITERKKTEEELLKAEKLESVGLLAGGIAHDFNNIMAAILVNVGLAKLSVKKEDKVLEKLNETEKAILRAKDLTHQLLTFSKGGAPIMSFASIGALLSDTADFTLSGSNVKCDCTVPDDLWDVEIDEGQVSQVIQNLILNAVQAMPEGGVIRIVAENVTIEAGKGLPLKEGRYIRISIKDRGIGIPKDHLGKIFDPFFTTKQKGSGLGLSTAYSIIKNHNGLITVDSELGKGAVFYIYLPASREKKVEKEKLEPEISQGEGKILVMDDEDIVLEATQELLREIGYTVEVARDGVEAIKRYEEAGETNQPFDVVILDLIVPGGLGGQETIQRLLEIDPKVKAVVSSGYSTDPVIAKHKEYGFTGAITKPYRIKELSTMLHKVMAG